MVIINGGVQNAVFTELVHGFLDTIDIRRDCPGHLLDTDSLCRVFGEVADCHDDLAEVGGQLMLLHLRFELRRDFHIAVAVRHAVGQTIRLSVGQATREMQVQSRRLCKVIQHFMKISDGSNVHTGDVSTVVVGFQDANNTHIRVVLNRVGFVLCLDIAPLLHVDGARPILHVECDVGMQDANVAHHANEGKLSKLGIIDTKVGIRVQLRRFQDLLDGYGPEGGRGLLLSTAGATATLASLRPCAVTVPRHEASRPSPAARSKVRLVRIPVTPAIAYMLVCTCELAYSSRLWACRRVCSTCGDELGDNHYTTRQ